MSLKQFLAVGRSFAGSPRDKSPFEMRKERILPKFESAPRFTARPVSLVQSDWLEDGRSAAAEAPATARQSAIRTAARSIGSRKRGKNLLELLTFGLLGKPKYSREFIQSEMSLEKIRVIRNDLADSDLELVIKKRKRAPKPEATEPSLEGRPGLPARAKRGEWTELTARLFEIGQH
ncbi:MAG TPA: hypothetical protein VK633_04765 [Verrucomicrobiae bacterium]|nr:hypothetical protein [Verrucomicrobiae bacterium]